MRARRGNFAVELVGLIAFALIGWSVWQNYSKPKDANVPQAAQPSPLLLQDWKLEGQYVVGTMSNASARKYSMVIVNFHVFDAQGNRIGTARDVLNSFDPGSTWKFKAPVVEAAVHHVQLGDITAI